MFGMSFTEILIIAVIAILFLGPDKLPQAMVKIAKFFKSFKSGINEAKQTLEQEVKMQELKDDAKKYQEKLQKSKQEFEKSIHVDAFEDAKKSIEEVKEVVEDVKDLKNV